MTDQPTTLIRKALELVLALDGQPLSSAVPKAGGLATVPYRVRLVDEADGVTVYQVDIEGARDATHAGVLAKREGLKVLSVDRVRFVTELDPKAREQIAAALELAKRFDDQVLQTLERGGQA
jgi:hypothetical protein